MLDFLGSVIQTSDGGYLFGGSVFSSDGDVSVNNGDPANTLGTPDCWLVKTDANGNIEWEQSFGGSEEDILRFNAVQATTDGGYVLAATSRSSDGDISQNQGGSDMWLIKIDANGTIEWEQNYGGVDYEFLTNAQQTDDGGYILVGGEDLPGVVYSTILIKTDAIGNVEWEQTYPVGCSGLLEQTNDGGFLIGGD